MKMIQVLPVNKFAVLVKCLEWRVGSTDFFASKLDLFTSSFPSTSISLLPRFFPSYNLTVAWEAEKCSEPEDKHCRVESLQPEITWHDNKPCREGMNRCMPLLTPPHVHRHSCFKQPAVTTTNITNFFVSTDEQQGENEIFRTQAQTLQRHSLLDGSLEWKTKKKEAGMIDGFVNLFWFFCFFLATTSPFKSQGCFCFIQSSPNTFSKRWFRWIAIYHEFHRRYFFLFSRSEQKESRLDGFRIPRHKYANHRIDDLPAWNFSCAACETIPTMTAFLVMSSRK